MLKFCPNLSLMFMEVDLLARFERAAKAGFTGVEVQFLYALPAGQVAEQLAKHKLQMVLHNLPAGNFEKGERGLGCLPDRMGEFQDSVGKAIAYAKTIGCRQLNCLSGIPPAAASADKVETTFIDNLRFAAKALEQAGMRLLVEPINTIDIPGFYLTNTRQALKLFDAAAHPNIWLQYDIYHMQVMEGDLTRTIRTHLKRIAHMQFADNPGRNEPGTGEIHFPNLFRFIEETGYSGWLGAEYKPAKTTEAGLGWAKPYLT